MKTKKNRKIGSGGKRAGAGVRLTKISDKKIPFSLSIKQSDIDLIGVENIRNLCYKLIQKEAERISKSVPKSVK
jgi:hypothetical protein